MHYQGQKLRAPPDDIMNLKRLCRVVRRLWIFQLHVNLKHRLSGEMEGTMGLLPFADSGFFHSEKYPGVISAMVEKELG